MAKQNPILKNALRVASVIVGITIFISLVAALSDGKMTIDSGTKIRSSRQEILLDTWYELSLAAVAFGAIAVGFVIAGIKPRLFNRLPLLPILLVLSFVSLFLLGLLAR